MAFLDIVDVTETSMIKIVITDDMDLVAVNRKYAILCIYVLRPEGNSLGIPSVNDLPKFDQYLTDDEKVIIHGSVDRILDTSINYQTIINEAK